MDNKQYKRIRNMFIASLLLLGIVASLLLFLVLSPKSEKMIVKNYVGESAYDLAVDNGFKGTETEWLQSLKGSDGINSISTNTTTQNSTIVNTQNIIKTIEQVPVNGTNGADGKDGTDGADAPVLQIRVDYDTCKLQTKYDYSRVWETIAQLPYPCEAEDD